MGKVRVGVAELPHHRGLVLLDVDPVGGWCKRGRRFGCGWWVVGGGLVGGWWVVGGGLLLVGYWWVGGALVTPPTWM